jgi:TonB family protein
MGTKAGLALKFLILFVCLLAGCTFISRKEMQCPSVASSDSDHKYYCEIGTLIESKFKLVVAETLGKNPELRSEFQDLHVEAELRLDREGNVKGIWLPTRSGNSNFDEAAKQALAAASPLPKPPKELFHDGNTLKLFWDFRLSE